MQEISATTEDGVPEQNLADGMSDGLSELVIDTGTEVIPDSEPLDDPLSIAPHVRSRYFKENIYPYAELMSRREYEAEKRLLQIELMKMQNSMRETGDRAIILFEGRDAAGKGGTIRRFMEHWNPRTARVVALDKPSEVEAGQWYFQRYIRHFPTSGEIVLFDRSWYNRAGVERVMGFSSDPEYRRFMRHVPLLERMIVDSGIKLIKLYFSVSQKEQIRRFHSRSSDPLKHWKVSAVDIRSIDKWREYTEAKEAMFLLTNFEVAPWTIIKSDDKKRARINAMRHLVNVMDYKDKDAAVAYEPDPSIVAYSHEVYTAGAPIQQD